MGDMAKDFDLLKRIVAPSSDKQTLPVDITRLTKIIREEIPAALEKQAPPNFPELYFDFEQVYGQFHDFLLFDKLIGKNIVALGGSFSSGKSTFLNNILGKSILPAKLDPSTSVPTYIIHGDNESAWGINEFDVKIDLTFPDIKSIAHGFGNTDSEDEDTEVAVKNDGITLGHLLQSVFVSAPELSYRNIAFLDTPGYSKPDSSSYSAKTDERIARAQLNSSNYILWFVPADAGVITADDVAFLDSLDKSIPKLIIITKADKAPNAGELESMREKVKSILDVKGIRYEDVLLFSRRKGQEYNKGEILAYLTKLDGAKQEVDFARSFKRMFVECRKFYDETLKEKERWMSRLNRALTYKGDNEDVNECLTDVSLDVKDSIKEIKSVRENLHSLQTEFFTEIKRVADCVKIKMPEPSEIDILEDNIKNPAIILKKVLKGENPKAYNEVIMKEMKRIKVSHPYAISKKELDLSSLDNLIQQARKNPFARHILASPDTSDDFVKSAYLILLMSIARVNSSNSNSLLYPCRIAISCQKEGNIDEYLKESILLTAKDVLDYAKSLTDQTLRDTFLFDALSMVCIHDPEDKEKLLYVSGLAILVGISLGEFIEIITLTKALLENVSLFDKKLSHVQFFIIYSYLPQFKSYIVENSNRVVFSNVVMDDDRTREFYNLDLISFQNCCFRNFKNRLFYAENVNYIEIINSQFEKFTNGVFMAVRIGTVWICFTKFLCCTTPDSDCDEYYLLLKKVKDPRKSLLGDRPMFSNVAIAGLDAKEVLLASNEFKDSYMIHYWDYDKDRLHPEYYHFYFEFLNQNPCVSVVNCGKNTKYINNGITEINA